jgi:hypothetical protein
MKRKCKICSKTFQVKHDSKTVKQLICSCKCAAAYYDRQKPKSRTLARKVARMIGRRSMGEVRFDRDYLEGTKIINAYEPEKFEYEVMETRKYTPDWRIIYRKDKPALFIEYKGVLDGRSRKLLKLVKEQYPEIDFRLVFEAPNNKIYKGSKTTYAAWADQHGFPWADNCLPKEWLK